MKKMIQLIFICLFIGVSATIAEDMNKEEQLAKNWEKVLNSAFEKKYVVTAKIFMGKSEKIVDVDRMGAILILTLKSNDKVALAMPFKSTDKDGNPMDLYFEFKK